MEAKDLKHKAYKYQIYPNKKQRILMNKTFGCSRFVFNTFLNLWNETFKETGKGLSYSKCSSRLTKLKKELEWLKEVDSIALQSSLQALSDSFDRFFTQQNKAPTFKSKKNPVQSYTTKWTNNNIAIEGNRIKLPKLGKVRLAHSRQIKGRIISATIRKHPTGKYFVSVLTEEKINKLSKADSTVGIDLGISDFAVLSNGEVIENNHYFRRLEVKLVKAQRTLSRRVKGSSNWHKQKNKSC